MNQSGRMSKGVIITICVVMVSAMLGGIGYWLATRDGAGDASSMSPETELASTDDSELASDTADYCTDSSLTTYRNETIGLEFCYPILWGATNLTPPQASESVVGSGYEIAFSAYDTVVSSITADYQNTIGRGGRCQDPTNVAPDFSTSSEGWTEDYSSPDLGIASRSHIKRDGVFLISETVDMFSSSLCYAALINQSGAEFPVVRVALGRPLGSTTIEQHVATPEALFSAGERTDFLGVVQSVRRPE